MSPGLSDLSIARELVLKRLQHLKRVLAKHPNGSNNRRAVETRCAEAAEILSILEKYERENWTPPYDPEDGPLVPPMR